MAEVTYFVALPFIAGDDGVAAGKPLCGTSISRGGDKHERKAT